MNDEKVVPMEDRIPALKEQRKRRANRRLILYLSVFFLLILFVVYFQSPLSQVDKLQVNGASYTEPERVTQVSGIAPGDHLWTLDTTEAKSRIEELPAVASASISRGIFRTVTIDVEERNRIAYVRQSEGYLPVLDSGDILHEERVDHSPSDAPVVYGFTDPELLKEFTAELAETGPGIVNRISEVTHDATEERPFQIRLFMNDGIEVRSQVPDFSERIQDYPTVAAEIDPSEPGVLFMNQSTYFEAPVVEDDGEDSEGESALEGESD
ncbi:cell division protein FtsQ [Salsuginibacillus halophilus]|uniref:Cell division protein DivIB n=1 Tax=Salsuginibacillus halophilus TaxID=517424 RepID=A0A2P8HX41_9BACI|nr:FtsQ-type POTRA domain-containing protein [Salsuginibacillus halophilus]PSL50768.1 cell division protein FtsQ [Salsuginibacillus halophilus]